MKFVVSRLELSNLIKKIQNVTPQSAPLPILSHFLIEAKNGQLIFTATDLTIGARASAQAHIVEEGALSIPSKRFFQLIRELTDNEIEVSGDSQEMAEIKSGTSLFRLHGMGKNEYPPLPDFAQAEHFQMPSSELKEMLFRTAFAVSKEDTRYVLTGLLMQIEKSKLRFVGADGKRLAKTETTVDLPPDFSGDYIIPLKAVDEIIKMLDSETATIYLADDKIAVESGTTILVTRLLAGEYPDFDQVITSKTTVSCQLHREELITLLRQIALFTTDSTNSVRFNFGNGELILTANCNEVGNGKVSMPVNYSGSQLEVAFNPHFFLDVLRHSKDETVLLSLSDSFNPGLVTDSKDALFIIMPMRLDP